MSPRAWARALVCVCLRVRSLPMGYSPRGGSLILKSISILPNYLSPLVSPILVIPTEFSTGRGVLSQRGGVMRSYSHSSEPVSGTSVMSERGASLPLLTVDKPLNRQLRDLEKSMNTLRGRLIRSLERGDNPAQSDRLRSCLVLAERQADALLAKALGSYYPE